jgi:hypothetical protein
MKKIFLKITLATLFMSVLVFWGCRKADTLAPELSTFAIETDDLIQVTNATPYVPVEVASNDNKAMDSIRISIIKKGTTTIAAFAAIRDFNSSNAAQQIVKVPFPLPFDAPSGKYTVVVISVDKKGNDSRKSYDVNIINNQFTAATPCAFTNLPIPAGKNTMVRVVVPAHTNGEDVYITGNFETFNGGGDWSGGNATFKMTKLSPTCFYIFLNLQNGMEIKFTRGDWSREDRDEFGNAPKNFKWVTTIPADNNFNYITGNYVDCFVKNWKDRVVLPSFILPTQATVTGKITAMVNVHDNDDSKKYFLVKKGGNLTDQSIPMYRVKTTSGTNTTRVAAAFPKNNTDRWLVVRGLTGEVGINAYGYEQELTWDGVNNPTILFLDRWKTQGQATTPSSELFVIGEATPGGWNNPVPDPAQKFTALGNGRFVINSIQLLGNKKMLFLPTNGDWGRIWGTGYDYLNGNTMGNLRLNGSDLDIITPNADAYYKIEVDLYKGLFKLTKL